MGEILLVPWQKQKWSDGVLEFWSAGKDLSGIAANHYSITPIFHYSVHTRSIFSPSFKVTMAFFQRGRRPTGPRTRFSLPA
jgi:hypothetical protein